jgi:hypothetical protein
MQRRFTIELQVDLQDPTQSDTVRSVVQAAVRHMYAMLVLGPFKPQVVIYSDDFLMKHEQIAALDDTIQQGKDMLAELGENVSEEAQVSDEMLTALRDIHGN